MRFGSTPRAERLPNLREKKKIVGCTRWSTKAREHETALPVALAHGRRQELEYI